MALSQDQIRGLDQLRQRLSLLANSIGTLRANVARSDPLPTWPNLHTSSQAVSFNLDQLLDTFNSYRQFLREAHAYPLGSFPGHTQEGLLQQLLRKKADPEVERWIDEYTTKFEQAGHDGANGFETGDARLNAKQCRELWDWAGPTSDGIVRPMLAGSLQDDFTIKERELGIANVKTGLKMKLEGQSESESGDDDDDKDDGVEEDVKDADEDKMEDVTSTAPRIKTADEELGVDPSAVPMEIDRLLRFATTGKPDR